MSLVGNEQAKLTATYLNGVAIALAAFGGIAPWIAFSQGSLSTLSNVGLGSGLCATLSIALHVGGRVMLRRLR